MFTVIRDPISHFLSGYNEIEYRLIKGHDVATPTHPLFKVNKNNLNNNINNLPPYTKIPLFLNTNTNANKPNNNNNKPNNNNNIKPNKFYNETSGIHQTIPYFDNNQHFFYKNINSHNNISSHNNNNNNNNDPDHDPDNHNNNNNFDNDSNDQNNFLREKRL
jgi:hypothetical protein